MTTETEIELLRSELAGAHARIAELQANGRQLLVLQHQIESIQAQLFAHQQAFRGEEEAGHEARKKATEILDAARQEAAAIIAEAQVRARAMVSTAEADADLLRATALDEGRRRGEAEAAALIEEIRHDIPPAETTTPRKSLEGLEASLRTRRPTPLPRLGIENADIWAKARKDR